MPGDGCAAHTSSSCPGTFSCELVCRPQKLTVQRVTVTKPAQAQLVNTAWRSCLWCRCVSVLPMPDLNTDCGVVATSSPGRSLLPVLCSHQLWGPGQGKDDRRQGGKAAPGQHFCSGSPLYCLAAETNRLVWLLGGFNWIPGFCRRSHVSISTEGHNESPAMRLG